jgi:hypothetical protein
MSTVTDVAKHYVYLTHPFQKHFEQRKAFAAKQVDKRREFIADSELDTLMLASPDDLGMDFMNSRTQKSFARLAHAYLIQTQGAPTGERLGKFANIDPAYFSQFIRKFCDIPKPVAFNGQIIGTGISNVGASNSNILDAVDRYEYLSPGASSIQRGIWVPEIDSDVGWLAGIILDSNIPSKGKQEGLMMALSAKVAQRSFIQSYLQPAFEQMFNYSPYYNPAQATKVPFSKHHLTNTDFSIGDKTVVSFFTDVLGMSREKEARGLPDRDRLTAEVYNSVMGGIVDWFGYEVQFKKKDDGRTYPFVDLNFGNNLPKLAQDVADLFGYKVRPSTTGINNLVHFGLGDTLVERVIKCKVRNPKILIPTLRWARQRQIELKNIKK